MKYGDKCKVDGRDGCFVTGFMDTPEGKFIRVKHTNGQDWFPADKVEFEVKAPPKPPKETKKSKKK